MVEFNKLSNLVDNDITIESVQGYKFKKWDAQNNKMLISDSYEKDYRKLWQVVTDKGQLDLGSGQMGNLLEGVMHSGKADIIGATFHVKSNGKTGMDIRYFLNAVKTAPTDTNDLPIYEQEGF
jgi:hypothetical protein